MRSPLKAKPLRNPGQSIDEKLIDIAFELVTYLTVALMLCSMALQGWILHFSSSPPSPIPLTLMAGVALAAAYFKIAPNMQSIKYLKQGRDGEKAVGQFLEKLRQDDADVFHDICGENFNIDHVVISTKGIFVVETKTWSKPDSGKPTIQYDGKTLKKNGRLVEPAPTEQAVACSRYLQDLLLESTGRKFTVQPVVTFPGWYIENSGSFGGSHPWVLNPKVITTFISNSKTELSVEDAKLAAYHLSRHIRATEGVI